MEKNLAEIYCNNIQQIVKHHIHHLDYSIFFYPKLKRIGVQNWQTNS